MNPVEIKNWDKLKTEADKNFVRSWSKFTTFTINDDGYYMMDLIAYPATPNAIMKKNN